MDGKELVRAMAILVSVIHVAEKAKEVTKNSEALTEEEKVARVKSVLDTFDVNLGMFGYKVVERS